MILQRKRMSPSGSTAEVDEANIAKGETIVSAFDSEVKAKLREAT